MRTNECGGFPMAGSDFSLYQSWFHALVENIGQVVKGKTNEVGMVVLALFAEGHVLLEDNPGTGKTTLAKSLAASVKGSWNRVQFTPDLLPADVTGGMVFRQQDGTFQFHPGPIFANVVLADEINRASPKTQSALLQVMEEGQVTVDGQTMDVPKPFVVMATQNPIEQEGTYRLPEAQLDRFMVKLSLGYPDHDAEVAMLESVGAGRRPADIAPIVDISVVGQMVAGVRQVHLEDQMRSYIVRLCTYTRDARTMPEVRLGASPRGAVALMAMARASAAAQGRGYVNVDDVRDVAPFVLAHRLLLTPDSELRNVDPQSLVRRAVQEVEAPAPMRVG